MAKNVDAEHYEHGNGPNVGSNSRDRVTLKNEIWLLGLALALALYGLSSVWTPLAGISRNAEDSLCEEVIESLLQPFT